MMMVNPMKSWEVAAYKVATEKARRDGFCVEDRGFELACTGTGAAFRYRDERDHEDVLAVVTCTTGIPDYSQVFGTQAREWYMDLADEYTATYWPGCTVRVDLYLVGLDERDGMSRPTCVRYEDAASSKWAKAYGV